MQCINVLCGHVTHSDQMNMTVDTLQITDQSLDQNKIASITQL